VRPEENVNAVHEAFESVRTAQEEPQP